MFAITSKILCKILIPMLLVKALNEQSNQVDNQTLIQINAALREHPVEKVGAKLRGYMSAMKKIV